MSVSTVSTFFAATAVFLAVLVVAFAAIALVARRSEAARSALGVVTASVGPQALWLAFATALAATLGSLYYSEIAGYTPCDYCWYQRIAMYPLVLSLGIAAARRDPGVRRYVLPPALIGAGIAGYHYLIQHVPSLSAGTCSLASPCTAAWVWKFDFVSIPFMAFVCFALIVSLVAIDHMHRAAGAVRP